MMSRCCTFLRIKRRRDGTATFVYVLAFARQNRGRSCECFAGKALVPVLSTRDGSVSCLSGRYSLASVATVGASVVTSECTPCLICTRRQKQEIGTPFDVAEVTDPPTNRPGCISAHNLTTAANILPRESLTTTK